MGRVLKNVFPEFHRPFGCTLADMMIPKQAGEFSVTMHIQYARKWLARF